MSIIYLDHAGYELDSVRSGADLRRPLTHSSGACPVRYEPTTELRDLLRRRQEWGEQLLEHADELDRHDRALLRGVYQLGMTITELADVVGRQPRTVRHRVLRLVRRILSPEFQYVLRHRRSWPASRRAIAERVILQGRTQREVAEEFSVSVHRVRQVCDRIRHAIEADCEQQASFAGTNGIAHAIHNAGNR
jgi:DNA-directed RNA polymerase specialized sigma24 family protein